MLCSLLPKPSRHGVYLSSVGIIFSLQMTGYIMFLLLSSLLILEDLDLINVHSLIAEECGLLTIVLEHWVTCRFCFCFS